MATRKYNDDASISNDLSWHTMREKYSFKYAQNYFSDSSLALIERASKIRQEWENNDGYKYVLNKVPKWVQPVLKSNYLESAYDLFDETIKISINNTKSTD